MSAAVTRKQVMQGKRAERASRLVEYYRLERDPFSGEGMSGLFFTGGDRKNIVEALLHFSRFGSAPQFLCGPVGGGKSTVLREFARRAGKDIDVAVITIDVLASRELVLQQILQAFTIVEYGQADATGSLYAWLRAHASRNRQAILCIDDVQHLEAGLLRELLALVAEPGLSFRIVFAGEPDARPRLESAVEAQGMLCNSLELSELNPQQVGEYTQYLLESAGYRGELPLNTMQMQAAAARSRGSIAQLNELLRDLLVAGADGSAAAARWSGYPLANLAVAVLLALVTVYFGWRSLETPAPVVERPIALAKVDAKSKPVLDDEHDVLANSTAERAGEEKDAKVEIAASVRGDAAKSNDRPARNSEAGMEETVSRSDSEGSGSESDAGDPARLTDVVPAAAAIAKQGASPRGKSESERAPEVPAAGELAVGSDAVRIAQRRADEQVPASPRNTGEPLPASVALARERAEQPASLSAAAPVDTAARDGQLEKVFRRLQAWPDEGYALQVFGTHNEARAKNLVEQYFGEADLLFYATRHNGKPWFVVINGPYSGRQAARESIDALPESLRRLRPWPRNIASIKSDILRFDELLGVTR
ncbi:MAG: AAA family ATPase [Pseudomonadales bacterium]